MSAGGKGQHQHWVPSPLHSTVLEVSSWSSHPSSLRCFHGEKQIRRVWLFFFYITIFSQRKMSLFVPEFWMDPRTPSPGPSVTVIGNINPSKQFGLHRSASAPLLPAGWLRGAQSSPGSFCCSFSHRPHIEDITTQQELRQQNGV